MAIKAKKAPPVRVQRVVRALRRALCDIRARSSPHVGSRGEDVRQYSDCWCVRCIAERALRPNDKLSDREPTT